METFMITELNILLLLGTIIGWAFFAFLVLKLMITRKKEIKLIEQIKQDLKIVKDEFKKLK
jgi:hypothetical protein